MSDGIKHSQKGYPRGLKQPKNLMRRWRNRSRFLMDMVSTDHKFYYSYTDDPVSVALLEEMIVSIHLLPGYFMCVQSPLNDMDPFMVIKRGGRRPFYVIGSKNIIDYVSAVSAGVESHGITLDDVMAVRGVIRLDPGFDNFSIKESDKEDES